MGGFSVPDGPLTKQQQNESSWAAHSQVTEGTWASPSCFLAKHLVQLATL